MSEIRHQKSTLSREGVKNAEEHPPLSRLRERGWGRGRLEALPFKGKGRNPFPCVRGKAGMGDNILCEVEPFRFLDCFASLAMTPEAMTPRLR